MGLGQENNEGGQRERTLTEKGQEFFEANKTKRLTKINRLWKDIEDILQHTQWKEIQSLVIMETKEQELLDKHRIYSNVVSDCVEFFMRSSDENAMEEYETLDRTNKQRNIAVEETFVKIHKQKQELRESSSSSGKSTVRSNASSTLAKKQAKVEAAQAKIKYLEKERDLMKQKMKLEEEEALMKIETTRKKAELDSNLNRLEHEKELAAAEAEVEALQMVESELEKNRVSDTLLPKQQETSEIRTSRYVNEHSQFTGHINLNPSARPFDPYSVQNPSGPPEFLYHLPQPTCYTHREQSPERPTPGNTNSSQNQVSSDLTKFLLRKDLLFARLTTFSEEPEAYLSWKRTFKQVMEELNIGPTEELELLIKWLGPVSSKYARSIKISNIDRPTVGVARLWDRLDHRYGCPEMVEAALKRKIEQFRKLNNRDNERLFELADILAEINSVKENPTYSNLLSYYDTSSGVLPIIQKLPHPLQEKWTSRAVQYKKKHNAVFPPFGEFLDFIQEMSYIKNDPGFIYDTNNNVEKQPANTRNKVTVKKTETTEKPAKTVVEDSKCILHPHAKHALTECKTFRSKPIEERRQFLKDSEVCFKCCASTEHRKRTCKTKIQCKECGSHTHCTAMHIDSYSIPSTNNRQYGGERTNEVDSKCTQICGNARITSKSCSKTVLVKVFHKDSPDNAVKLYAIIDDQSNRSLVKSKLLNDLQIKSGYVDYILTSCAGSTPTKGRSATDLIVQSLDGNTQLKLPSVIECNHIPHNRSEIPTPNIAKSYPHLRDIAGSIPDLDNSCDTLLLIGRDLLEAHHVLDQRLGPKATPYAQRLHLGWVIVGEACHNGTHVPEIVNVNKINILGNGRPSLLLPCNNSFDVKEIAEETAIGTEKSIFSSNKLIMGQPIITPNPIDSDIFARSAHDENIGFSEEDRNFLSLMDEEFKRDCDGSWKAPLPFKKHKQNYQITDHRL